jgi:acyl carrier protein
VTIARAEVLERLRAYIANDVLDGKDVGLTEETPLLEWGIVNSFEIVKLLAFIDQAFGIDVPAARVIAENFKTIRALAELVVALDAERAPAAP